MKKILLIEDRSQRQKDFLEKINIDLNDYADILDNKIDDDYLQFIQDIHDNNFDLDNYEVIIAHNSIFIGENSEILSKLKTYCKEKKKPLVLFSGNDDKFYNKSEYEELGISSSQLYSENLKIFLEEFQKENINILILSFGKKWKLNIVLNCFDKINMFIKKNQDENIDDIDIDEFFNETKFQELNSLNIDFYQMEVEDNWVYLCEIIKLKDDIYSKIEEMAEE
jgi:hypothetical protein